MNQMLSILAGFVDGLTSGLPLSESGHRLIFAKLTEGDFLPLMPLAVVLALILVFHKTLFLAIASLFDMAKKSKEGKFRWTKAGHYQKLMAFSLLGAAPYWMMALLRSKFALLDGLGENLLLAGILLLLNAGLLFIGEFSEEKNWDAREMKGGHAIKLGLFQAASFLPGFSRMGMALCMGRNMGFKKETALEFAALSGIFALLGGELIGIRGSIGAVADWGIWALGFAAAFLGAVLGLLLLKVLVKKECSHFLLIWSALAGIGAIVLNIL